MVARNYAWLASVHNDLKLDNQDDDSYEKCRFTS